MIHLLFIFIQNIFFRCLFLIIKSHFSIIHIRLRFILSINLFTKFQIMFLKELSLNKFLFLHVARFIICNENLIK